MVESNRVLGHAWSNLTLAGALLLTAGCGDVAEPIAPLPANERPAAATDALATHDHTGAFPGFAVEITVAGDDVVLEWLQAGLDGADTVLRSEDPHLLANLSAGAPLPPGVDSLPVSPGATTFVDVSAADHGQPTPNYFYRVSTVSEAAPQLSTMVMKVTRATTAGYNKMGLCMLSEIDSAADLLPVFGDSLVAVWGWDPANQSYLQWTPADGGDGFPLTLGNVFSAELDGTAASFHSLVGVVPTDEQYAVSGESGSNWATMPAMYDGPSASHWVEEAGFSGVGQWHNDTQETQWYWGEGYEDFDLAGCGTYYLSLPEDACLSNADCGNDMYCHFIEEAACGSVAPGLCLPEPMGCDGPPQPVCGCDGQTYPTECDAQLAGVSTASPGECPLPDADGDGDPDGSDCAPDDPSIHAGAADTCNGIDDDCDGVADQACETPAIELPAPTHPPVADPTTTGVCGRFAVMEGMPNPHLEENLSTYMTSLEAAAATEQLYADINFAEFDNGCVSEGDFPGATAVPVGGAGNLGARMRGYLNIPAPMTWTLAVVGNDSIDVQIGGSSVATVSWSGLGWKRTVGVSFPQAGLYPLEVQWSSNQVCGLDPLEFGHAFSVIPGDNDTIQCGPGTAGCPWTAATHYTFIDSTWYVPTTHGGPTSCEQCAVDADCSAGVCNDAGLCE